MNKRIDLPFIIALVYVFFTGCWFETVAICSVWYFVCNWLYYKEDHTELVKAIIIAEPVSDSPGRRRHREEVIRLLHDAGVSDETIQQVLASIEDRKV